MDKELFVNHRYLLKHYGSILEIVVIENSVAHIKIKNILLNHIYWIDKNDIGKDYNGGYQVAEHLGIYDS